MVIEAIRDCDSALSKKIRQVCLSLMAPIATTIDLDSSRSRIVYHHTDLVLDRCGCASPGTLLAFLLCS
jgi:hypothetical protein